MCACASVNMRVFACASLRVYQSVSRNVFRVCVCIHLFARGYVCVCVCMCVYLRVQLCACKCVLCVCLMCNPAAHLLEVGERVALQLVPARLGRHNGQHGGNKTGAKQHGDGCVGETRLSGGACLVGLACRSVALVLGRGGLTVDCTVTGVVCSCPSLPPSLPPPSRLPPTSLPCPSPCPPPALQTWYADYCSGPSRSS